MNTRWEHFIWKVGIWLRVKVCCPLPWSPHAGSHKVAMKNNPEWGLTVSKSTAQAEETEAAKQFQRIPQLILFSKNSWKMISSSILALLSCLTFMCVVSHYWLVQWEPSQIPEPPLKCGPLPTYRPSPCQIGWKQWALCKEVSYHAELPRKPGDFVGVWSVPMETD